MASTPGSAHARCAASAARAPRPPSGNRAPAPALLQAAQTLLVCRGPEHPATHPSLPVLFRAGKRDLTPFASINLSSEKEGLSQGGVRGVCNREGGRALTTRCPGLRGRHCKLNSCVHMHACVCV